MRKNGFWCVQFRREKGGGRCGRRTCTVAGSASGEAEPSDGIGHIGGDGAHVHENDGEVLQQAGERESGGEHVQVKERNIDLL